jgi:hypothetical protein
MVELPQEELNGLSPRARKSYGESANMLQEIVEGNPNAGRLETVTPKKSKQKKGNKNEKL